MCGDSRCLDDLLKLLAGEKPDMAFTSPPYGIGLNYASYDDSFANTYQLVQSVLPNLCAVTQDYIVLNWCDIIAAKKINGTKQPSMYSWLPVYEAIMRRCGWYIWAERIWKKPHQRCRSIWTARSNRPANDFEYLGTWAHQMPGYDARNNGSQFGIIDSAGTEVNTLRNHPGAMPEYVAEKMIKIHTRQGGSVIDPFGGSGTTLIACEVLDRACYLMEIDPRYCEQVIERWEKMTGEKARLGS